MSLDDVDSRDTRELSTNVAGYESDSRTNVAQTKHTLELRPSRLRAKSNCSRGELPNCRCRLVGLARARRNRPSIRGVDRTFAKSSEVARSELYDGRYVRRDGRERARLSMVTMAIGTDSPSGLNANRSAACPSSRKGPLVRDTRTQTRTHMMHQNAWFSLRRKTRKWKDTNGRQRIIFLDKFPYTHDFTFLLEHTIYIYNSNIFYIMLNY